MSLCESCGKELTILNRASFDQCAECFRREAGAKASGFERIKSEEAALIDKVMLTTETAPNLNITKRIEIVTAECAFGMNIFKDLFAGIRDIVGGRSEAVQKTLRDSRKTALYELKKEAHAVGANAVVGVDLDYVELSAAGNMVLLVASGTAVVIDE
jgi:uncharacterized protein YbjQ (UPF0145 family)